MPLHGRVIRYVIERTGAKLIPAGYRAFRKYDVQTTNRLFGKSGGKGFRHGRDLGLILGEYIGEDDLDAPSLQPPNGSKTYRKYQARNRYKRFTKSGCPVCNRYRRNKRYS